MLILDSDHLSFLEWGGPESMRLRERLAEYPEKTVAVSIISYEEQMRGWMAYIARARSISARVHSDGVVLETGEELRAKAVVVATESPAAAELLGDPILGDPIASSGQGVTCLYFSAPRSPIDKPILILNGDGRGPINSA